MTLSDAVEVVGHLIGCYPNGGANAGRSYIGALASVLGSYPRLVAEGAADPLHGVPRECKFLPTPADLIEWCDRETKKLRASLVPNEYEQRRALAHEECIRRKQEEQQLIENRKQRPTLDALRAKYGPTWRLSGKIHRRPPRPANTRLFDRECQHAGIDPAKSVSPSLIALMTATENGDY